jgi:CRP/FNR family transcriptional regulator
MAAFLTDLGQRYAARGFSGTQFQLSMSRGDIANYLRLAAETVSRVLSRFRSQKLIQVEGRQLEILDPQGLHHIGRSLLQD